MSIKKNLRAESRVSLDNACTQLGVSRSGFLAWNSRMQQKSSIDKDFLCAMHKIVEEFPYYGYPRVTKALQREGYKVNHKRVYRLMKEHNLLCKLKKYKPVTTQSNHNFPKYSNLAKGFVPTAINQLIVADITYIALLTEFVYLAILMDVFSRKFIGWDLSRNVDTQLTLRALNMVIALRGKTNLKNCIHHSDQGVQYAADAYVQRLEYTQMRPSMGEVGNSYENAFAESAIKTIKYNEVYMKEYDSFADAYINIKKFIEEVYNKKQLHSGIGFVPPDEFEMMQKMG